eukprot:TRINITY_DN24507_c0_g1_i1.p2 TRINITY_DN24507_c0_g1~~TRINITY_DN24507_c0_g1_i1.p2  ORF type:complete len:109 (-),score=22.86 TRINITY_DN24507_c0_g1_i1:62-388(-)
MAAQGMKSGGSVDMTGFSAVKSSTSSEDRSFLEELKGLLTLPVPSKREGALVEPLFLAAPKAAEALMVAIARFTFTIADMYLELLWPCLLYTSPSPRDRTRSRMPSSA